MTSHDAMRATRRRNGRCLAILLESIVVSTAFPVSFALSMVAPPPAAGGGAG
jgi:hypothetical protein